MTVTDIRILTIRFMDHLKASGLSEHTLISYRRNLDWFMRHLDKHDIANVRNVTRQVILDYRETVMAENNAPETKALKIRSVRRLFDHLVRSHKLLINPAQGVEAIRAKSGKLQPVLTVEEMKRLLKQPDCSIPIGIRNKTVLSVMYATGIRLDELLNLTLHDVDLKDGVLYIRLGKGSKDRMVPLGKKATKPLSQYISSIRPHLANKNKIEEKLFLNRSGHRLKGGSVRSFLRNYRISAGIDKTVSPHTLRRTCATHLLQQGADIRYIQKLLGHKRLETTQAYTRVMPVEVKNTHTRTHPNRNR